MLILFLIICIPLVAAAAFGAGLSLKGSLTTKFSELPKDRQKFFTEVEVTTSIADKMEIESYLLSLDERWVKARKNGDKDIQMGYRIEKIYNNNKSYFKSELKKLGYKAIEPWDILSNVCIVPIHQTFWNS